MYEKFLDKNPSSICQTVDDAFIAKYANVVSENISHFGKKLDLECFARDYLGLLNLMNIRQ